MQEVAAASLHRHLVELRDRSVRDGAVLVVDNLSGEVLAYVGSSGSLSSASQVDGVRALRQAGPTLKPFLYASAIDRGLVTPATLLEDTALDVSLPGGSYRPANYDETFRGMVSVRTALASSLNIPAVRTLALVGDAEFARTLRALGISSVARPGDFYGPSLALGSADVSLWELVSAYRALAAGGTWKPLRLGVAGVEEPHRVFEADTAFLVGHILSDREGRATTFGLENALATPFWSAVKTGTSKDMRDNWCVGYTSRFTVGVWVGNFSGESMHDVSGVTGAAPVWQEVMSALHANEPGGAPPAPENVVEAWTSFANDSEPARREFYRRGSEPVRASRELDSIPRIAAPVDGSILALDPDIAPDRQRVALTVHAPRADLAWRLDGRPLASAGETYLWEPHAGRHVPGTRGQRGAPVGRGALPREGNRQAARSWRGSCRTPTSITGNGRPARPGPSKLTTGTHPYGFGRRVSAESATATRRNRGGYPRPTDRTIGPLKRFAGLDPGYFGRKFGETG